MFSCRWHRFSCPYSTLSTCISTHPVLTSIFMFSHECHSISLEVITLKQQFSLFPFSVKMMKMTNFDENWHAIWQVCDSTCPGHVHACPGACRLDPGIYVHTCPSLYRIFMYLCHFCAKSVKNAVSQYAWMSRHPAYVRWSTICHFHQISSIFM